MRFFFYLANNNYFPTGSIILYFIGIISGAALTVTNFFTEPIISISYIILLCSIWIAIVTIFIINYRSFVKFNHDIFKKNAIYKELQEYINNYSSNIEFWVNNKYEYNGVANGNKFIAITVKWFELIYSCPENHDSIEYQNYIKYKEFVKCTICHELYHISLNHPIIQISEFRSLCPFKSIRDKHYIERWQEEFAADRYGCQLYGNKKIFLEKMQFMLQQELIEEGKKKRKKKRKHPLSEHPTWEMRIKYIEQDIEPTLERVKEEFYKYYT